MTAAPIGTRSSRENANHFPQPGADLRWRATLVSTDLLDHTGARDYPH